MDLSEILKWVDYISSDDVALGTYVFNKNKIEQTCFQVP